MPRYQFANQSLDDEAGTFLNELAAAHAAKFRPRCLCQAPHPEMYVAKVADSFIIKRMPGTGIAHESGCDHFDPPPSLSGLGDVLGRAIQPKEDGNTVLKLEFSLSKMGPRSAVTPSEAKGDTVKSDAKKLTLLGLLHYLWHEADLHKWSPRFANKRSWAMVYRRLSEAAAAKETKKIPLLERLFLPEPYNKESVKQIDARRRQQLAPFLPPKTGSKTEMFILVGEFKAFEESRFGFKMLVKHAPSMPIFFDSKMETAIRKRYGYEFAIAEANETLKLVTIATVYLNPAGSAQLAEISFMLTNQNWIPVETTAEAILIETLTTEQRSFNKGLRFNVQDRPIASVLLTDTKPPCAMYIQPPEADETYHEIVSKLEAETGMATWLWDAEEDGLPELPAKQG